MTITVDAPTVPLSSVVAANIRAVAAVRGRTQTDMARLLGMNKTAISDRYRERTPWTLDEMQKVARLLGVEVSDLLARPKGPLTFWLGADNTVTGTAGGRAINSDRSRWLTFCDECGCSLSWWASRHDDGEGRALQWVYEHVRSNHLGAGVERAA